jgi:hypothetical protein
MNKQRDEADQLPVPVKDHPFWRVEYRPDRFVPDLIPSLTECVKLVEKARVRLRGWDFPHLANRTDDNHGIVRGSNWIGSWANFMGSVEYWRLYQSGQFVHLAAVRETTETEWRPKLQADTMSHLSHVRDIDWDKVPGYISIVNLVYTVTEFFEFAARICQAGVYRGSLDISIELNGVKDFVLTTEWGRAWWQYCPASENHLAKTWQVSSDGLVSGSTDHSMKAIVWLCECFGWLEPNVDALRADQQKLLSGRL